jgi:hypothetical protein
MLGAGSGAVPVFVTVTICGGLDVFLGTLPKFSDVGDAENGTVPVPFTMTDCVVAPETATFRFDATAPAAVGVNTTLIVQVEPAATGALHVLVCEKLAGDPPVNVTPETVSATPPVLVTVTGSGALDVFAVTKPNAVLAGDSAVDRRRAARLPEPSAAHAEWHGREGAGLRQRHLVIRHDPAGVEADDTLFRFHRAKPYHDLARRVPGERQRHALSLIARVEIDAGITALDQHPRAVGFRAIRDVDRVQPVRDRAPFLRAGEDIQDVSGRIDDRRAEDAEVLAARRGVELELSPRQRRRREQAREIQ